MSLSRRHPLLSREPSSSHGGARFAEVAGGTTAECAAICCCCPCGIFHLAFLVLYKFPTGIFRKFLKKRRLRRLMKKELLSQQQPPPRRRRCTCGCEEVELRIVHGSSKVVNEYDFSRDIDHEKKEVMELENEMWNSFCSTGFWRSSSQRD